MTKIPLPEQFINPHTLPVIYHTKPSVNRAVFTMMLGELRRHNPTVQIPPGGDYSPLYLQKALSALQHYFPSDEVEFGSDSDFSGHDPVDAYSCDHFRMFEFKIRRCPRGRAHDWTECPYAHPGEKARRRDPRKFHYSGTACPEFKKGSCRKGESCEFAHGVFECWLHPARYRTQPCKDGVNCPRRVCFFAHSPEQLRVLPSLSPRSVNSVSADTQEQKSLFSTISPAEGSPENTPPVSPVSQTLVGSFRNLQLGKVQSLPSACIIRVGSSIRPGFLSLPNTPTRNSTRRHAPPLDFWDTVCEEEPVMERVESGRDLRVRMFEKLSKENPLERLDPTEAMGVPDLGWISELVK